MRDRETFESRLTDAVTRYADLAPDLDHRELAGRAIGAESTPRSTILARWFRFGSVDQGRLPAVYLLVLIVLLTAALVAAVAVGMLRSDPVRPLGRNGEIAFYVQGPNHAGNHSYVMNFDGTGVHDSSRVCGSYSWDGSIVSWMSSGDATADVVVERVDGSMSTRISIVPDYSFDSFRPSYSLSPDGTLVAWMKPIREIGIDPSDGSRVVQGRTNELWMTPVAGGPGRRLVPVSDDPSESYGPPVWSPDGRHIAFVGYVAGSSTRPSHRSAIYVFDLAGSDPRRLTTRPAVGGLNFSWSPDGSAIAYLGLPDGTALPAADSPNPSFADERLDVFVVGTDGTGDRNVTNSSAFDDSPAWSPDRRGLAFRTSDDGEHYYLATMGMEGPTQAGIPVRGPETWWFVWSPDGAQLLWLASGPRAGQTTIQVVDRDFGRASTTLLTVEGSILCPPSWQRLDP